jgi:asparaginyl-tRNA synthetase
MNKVHISELGAHEGSRVTLQGWVYGKRSGGKVVFLVVRDGTGLCQCVVEASAGEAFNAAAALGQESSLRVTGSVRREDRAPGGYEIAVSGLEVIHSAQDYPITPKEHGVDFLMSRRHLWLRSKRPTAILRIRAEIIRSCREFFDSRGFTLVDTPILVPGAGEDTQTLFPVEYFDETVFLAQTGQLYLESAALALGRVYCFGPTFRAEKSKTRRHLTEFWMVEPEIAYADLDEVISVAEGMLHHIVESVIRRHEKSLLDLGRDIDQLKAANGPFARITYTEAVDMLRSPAMREKLESELERDRKVLQEMVSSLNDMESQIKAGGKAWKIDQLTAEAAALREEVRDLEQDLQNRPKHIELAQNFEWGKDLGGSDETIISRHFDVPVFVTHYPKQAKAFYMKEDPDDPRVVKNVDLLAPHGYGEIIGGSQREDDLDRLVARMREHHLKPEDYDWYLDLRRYGSVPHGGFGLGIERTVAWICGLKHVRETIPFPRTMGRIYP